MTMRESWMRLIVGVLAGGAWNLASLWCLTQLVRAWLGPRPSRRRALIWLVVKFPLLYAATVLMCYKGMVSIVGFSIGFSVVLAASIVWLWWRAQRMATAGSHGR